MNRLVAETGMKTNFDRYLDEHLRDTDFAERFEQAGEAWDIEAMG